MNIKDLLDFEKKHPYLVISTLFCCVTIGGFLGVIYVNVSNERLEVRQERLALMDDRLKQQEEATKRQKQINKYVQEQLSALRTGFSGLPPAIEGAKYELNDALRKRSVKHHAHAKIHTAISSVERHAVVLKTAIENSEALQKALEPFLNGAAAEDNSDFEKAAALYFDASQLGLAEADARLARLYMFGKGVEADTTKAKQLYERAALKGAIEAKFALADLYLTGTSVSKDPVRAVAYLYVQPSFVAAIERAQKIEVHFTKEDTKRLQDTLKNLEHRQADLLNVRIDPP
jgi:hypothetical protein